MASVYNKYGVPDSSGNMEAAIQPKLQYRFKVTFTDFGGVTDSFALSKNIVSATIPNFSQEPVDIHSYVSLYYVLGKHSFETFQIVLRNDASNTVAGIVQSQLDRQHNTASQTHSPAAGSIKFHTKILFLDGSNGDDVKILEGWHVTGCTVTAVDWGSLDYSASDANQITLTIRPDNAFHIVDEGNLGNEESVSWTGSSAVSDAAFDASVDDDFSAT